MHVHTARCYTLPPQVKVSLLNFTITIKGLEEQLLNTAVKEELPDLAQKKVRPSPATTMLAYVSKLFFPARLCSWEVDYLLPSWHRFRELLLIFLAPSLPLSRLPLHRRDMYLWRR